MKSTTIKNIDPEIFRKFKVACAENDIDMRSAILGFMDQFGSDQMYEISDGVNTAHFDNLFIGLDTMLQFHAEGRWIKIRKV